MNEYFFDDFTIENYCLLLDIAKRNFEFVDYNTLDESVRFVIWRHDVDYSPHRSLRLAEAEHKMGVQATYFVWLHSNMYHFFEKEVSDILKKIMNLGHHIGLHFDAGYYGILNGNELETHVDWERKILEKTIGRKIDVFSHHNPNPNILKYDDYSLEELAELYPHYFKSSVCGLTNTYGEYFRNNVPYCSDSNGYWRFKRLQDVLEDSAINVPRLQVLTHPVWWTDEIANPRDRLLRCIDGRSRNNSEFYDSLLKTAGRKNI